MITTAISYGVAAAIGLFAFCVVWMLIAIILGIMADVWTRVWE